MRSNAAAFALILCLAAVPAAAQDVPWKAETATRLDDLHDIALSHNGTRVIIHAGDRWFRLSLPRGLFLLSPLKDTAAPDHGVTIPDGRAAVGSGIVAVARLTGPTSRYGHGVLGDKIEAEALTVEFTDGGEAQYLLPDDSVFEDLEPRIVTVDGEEAVLVVRSYREFGAALATYRVADDAITPLAESRPIGQPFRWQNPVGAADFDGDGRTEIASVVTPHLSGVLTLYRRSGEVLEPVASAGGFANHYIGSTVLGMHAIADIDGDGVSDIVLPSLDRRQLRAVTFAGGKARILNSIDHDVPIITSVVMAELNGEGAPEIIYGLANGAIIGIKR